MKKIINKTQNLKTIQEIASKLLELMGLKNSKIELKKEEEMIKVNINPPDPGLLIGSQGENLSCLQLILSLMVYKKLGFWQPLLINVGDWLEKRQESLKKMALNAAQKVKFSGQEVMMSGLNSAERRLVHLALADSTDVITESIGEGRERRLVVKPKGKK